MKSNYKNYNKIKSPSSELGQKIINNNKNVRYQQSSSCQLQHQINITKEELYHLYKQEASKVKFLSAINNALVQSVQNTQRQTEQRVQQIRSNYKSSIQQLRYTYSEQIRLYSNKICLFQQQVQNLNAKIHQLKAQFHNKNQKIASLEKVLDLLLENKTSSKNQIKQKLQKQDSNVMLNNININQITQLAAQLTKTQDHLNKTMRNYQQLDQKRKLLQSELSQKSHELLVNTKSTDSLKTQIDYFKQQNQELKQKIKNHLKNKKELQEKLLKMEKQYQIKHQGKYLDMVNKINILNQKINELEKSNKKFINELENSKQKISQSNNSLALAVQKAKWYEKLLNQAKQNFIYSQLKKQDQVNNIKRQNKQMKIELNKIKRKTQHTKSLLYSQNDMNFINQSRKGQNDQKLHKNYEQFNEQKRQSL